MSTLRGLDTRAKLASARIYMLVDPEVGNDALIEVWMDAMADGGEDAKEGIATPPVMFEGEPQLLNCWRTGYENYWLAVDTCSCSFCQNDDTGNPCPDHG